MLHGLWPPTQKLEASRGSDPRPFAFSPFSGDGKRAVFTSAICVWAGAINGGAAVDRSGPDQARHRPGGPVLGRRAAGHPQPDQQADADDPGGRGDVGTRDHAGAAARGHRQGEGCGEIQRAPYQHRRGADQATARRVGTCGDCQKARYCPEFGLPRVGDVAGFSVDDAHPGKSESDQHEPQLAKINTSPNASVA